eukprot:1797293-Prymnesium_polylepis.1
MRSFLLGGAPPGAPGAPGAGPGATGVREDRLWPASSAQHGGGGGFTEAVSPLGSSPLQQLRSSPFACSLAALTEPIALRQPLARSPRQLATRAVNQRFEHDALSKVTSC